MTSIQQNSGYATLINVVHRRARTVPRELADLLHAATEEVMRHQPGFRSANIHVSTDGTRVVNYAQWDTAEAYRAMLDDPTTREHMAEAAALAIELRPAPVHRGIGAREDLEAGERSGRRPAWWTASRHHAWPDGARPPCRHGPRRHPAPT